MAVVEIEPSPQRSSVVAAIVDVCKMSRWSKFNMAIATSRGIVNGPGMGRMAGQGWYALWGTVCGVMIRGY